MPAELQFFDMSVAEAPAPYVPIPVTLGPNWQPNDLRFFVQGSGAFTGWVTPPGYTVLVNPAAGQGMICYRRLVAGDTDTLVQYQIYTRSDGYGHYNSGLFTVRGASSATPTAAMVTGPTLPSASSTGGTVAAGSFSISAAGAIVLYFTTTVPVNPAIPTACTLGCPPGWANLVASAGSGVTYTPFGSQASEMYVAQSFSSSGSSGTVTLSYGAETAAIVNEFSINILAAADVSATATSPTNPVATATDATFSVSTAVTLPTGSASAVSSATTAFNPLYGQWISDPQALSGDPVTGSIVRWVQLISAAGSAVLVETSINNGVSWDAATNNGPVARLAVGDTTTSSVLLRVTLSRLSASDAAPKVSSLELQVSANASVDELVPVGHGMIDKVTVNAVGGTQGTGTVTNTVSSSAVLGRGGGQTGSGTSIKVHVTDLSGSIKRNVWAMPYTVPAGLNYGAAAQAMVVNRLPDQTAFAISTTTRITPLLAYGMQQGGDPWQDIQDLATAIGYEAFFDAKGVFTFRPVPDPSIGDAVWAFDEDNIPLVAEATRELSNEQTFNHVIVVGQSTSSSNPVTAEAFDNNPSSPTYILGPYGEVTERLTFSTITTQDQAQAAANALLLNSLGGADTVTIVCVPQPALEPGDIVKINCGDVNVDGNYMINSMSTSLSPADPQQLVCFRQSTS
jgi:hypothetical protein